MDTKDKLFAFVESSVFMSDAYVVNNLASFTTYAESSEEFNNALGSFSIDPVASAEILSERINKLLAQPNDEQYVHPYDAAIAVYVYLISLISKASLREVIASLKLPDNMWWAKQMVAVLSSSLSQTPETKKFAETSNVVDNSDEHEFTSNTNSVSNDIKVERL